MKFAINLKLKHIDHHFPAIYIESVLNNRNFFCNTGICYCTSIEGVICCADVASCCVSSDST